MMQTNLRGLSPNEIREAIGVGDVVTFYADDAQQSGFVVGFTARKPIKAKILFLRWASGYDCLSVPLEELLWSEGTNLTPAKQRSRIRRLVKDCRSKSFPKTTKRAKGCLDEFFEGYFERFPMEPDHGEEVGQ